MNKEAFNQIYPFESHYFDIDGLRYHYLDEGDKDKPVLIMLHGNPTWSFYYRNLILALRDNYRVIVPDHIGCGFSDKPQDYDYQYENHVKNVRRFVESLNLDTYSLIMHDWGGPIGYGLAVDAPEKVNKMLIFNTTCNLAVNYPWRIKMCRIPLFGSLIIRGFNYFTYGATVMACKDRSKMTPAVKAGYLMPYNNWANRIANHRFVENIPLSKDHPTYQFGAPIIAKLDSLKNKPVMICWGDRDFCFTESFLQDLKVQFPAAEVHQ